MAIENVGACAALDRMKPIHFPPPRARRGYGTYAVPVSRQKRLQERFPAVDVYAVLSALAAVYKSDEPPDIPSTGVGYWRVIMMHLRRISTAKGLN